jgi:hypothetical protein
LRAHSNGIFGEGFGPSTFEAQTVVFVGPLDVHRIDLVMENILDFAQTLTERGE